MSVGFQSRHRVSKQPEAKGLFPKQNFLGKDPYRQELVVSEPNKSSTTVCCFGWSGDRVRVDVALSLERITGFCGFCCIFVAAVRKIKGEVLSQRGPNNLPILFGGAEELGIAHINIVRGAKEPRNLYNHGE